MKNKKKAKMYLTITKILKAVTVFGLIMVLLSIGMDPELSNPIGTAIYFMGGLLLAVVSNTAANRISTYVYMCGYCGKKSIVKSLF